MPPFTFGGNFDFAAQAEPGRLRAEITQLQAMNRQLQFSLDGARRELEAERQDALRAMTHRSRELVSYKLHSASLFVPQQPPHG